MKLELHREIFEKYPNIKFNKNSSDGSRVVPYRRKDGNEPNSHFFSILRTRIKWASWLKSKPDTTLALILKTWTINPLSVTIH